MVLGNPGSGKSVLVKSLICDIIEANKLRDNSFVFPLRIELRKYLSFKKSNSGNILKYIVALLEEEYSINNLSESILERILKNEKSYIFFDGLDEIFKIEDKIEIKNDIENFHNNYTEIKSLTTSRIIGYEDAKLKDDVFCELMILSFDDDQIEEYIEKWYEKEEENYEIRIKEIEGFLSKMHEIDRELVSNPLLLSLIVILYRNILKLPESKLEIYQSCTKTLVDKWDASKDLLLDIQSDLYKNKEKILADLAYWQYEQLSGEEVIISYTKAKKTVTKSVKEKLNISDELDCEDLAESFMSYAEKRSIYFDNNFTHKTFLEYYTAYWIYSNIEKKHKIDRRNEIISKYIDNSFWHIVLELLLNMIDKDQADSEIMDELVSLQLNQKDESLPFLLSTITSFKNISQKMISETINKSIDKIINSAKENKHTKRENYRESLDYQIYDWIKHLYLNAPPVKEIIVNKIKNAETSKSSLDLYYALYMEMHIFPQERSNTNFKLVNKDLFHEYCNNNKYLFLISIYYNRNTKDYLNNLIRFINNFGIDAVFESISSIFDDYSLGPFINAYINMQIRNENIKDIAKNLDLLESKGLSKKSIYNFVKNKDYFFLRKNILKGIIDVQDDVDLETKKILLTLLFKIDQHSLYMGFSKISSYTEDETIIYINNIKNIEEKLKFIDNLKK